MAGNSIVWVAVVIRMGCNASARIAAQLSLTKEEVETLRRDIRNSSELRTAIEQELVKVRTSATVLTSENEKLKHDLILKAGDGGGLNASVFESAREEQERSREWIVFEIRECNNVLSSLTKMHGSDESGATGREVKKLMENLEESQYVIDKLKDFSDWKYKRMRLDLEGMLDNRAAWLQLLHAYEEDIKMNVEQLDRDSAGRLKPQLMEIRAKMGRLPSAAQSLERLKAIREIDKTVSALRVSSSSEVDSETKAFIAKQAEDIKNLTQRLASQRKAEEDRKGAYEKDLSLKEVHIKHLENKVKDLSRPSIAEGDAKSKDKELERLKKEMNALKAAQKSAEEQLEAANKTNEDLAEQVRAQEEELESLRS